MVNVKVKKTFSYSESSFKTSWLNFKITIIGMFFGIVYVQALLTTKKLDKLTGEKKEVKTFTPIITSLYCIVLVILNTSLTHYYCKGKSEKDIKVREHFTIDFSIKTRYTKY